MTRKIISRFCRTFIVSLFISLIFNATLILADNTWDSYFGQNEGWYEGAIGHLTYQTEDSWTAKMDIIGWGGVLGARVKNERLNLKKGVEYSLKFNMQSTDIDKWVFVEISNDSNKLLYGDWIHLNAGEWINYDKRFILNEDATKVIFCIGGEFGDRIDEADMYALVDSKLDDGDSVYSTSITMERFSISGKIINGVKSAKNNSANSIDVKINSISKAKLYQIEWSKKKNFKDSELIETKKAKCTIKNVEKGKWYIRVRAKVKYSDGYEWTQWSEVKGVKVKKAKPFVTYKSLKLLKGDSYKIKVYNKTGKEKYVSNNQSIVSVSNNGKVKGLKAGKGKVTITSGKTVMQIKITVIDSKKKTTKTTKSKKAMAPLSKDKINKNRNKIAEFVMENGYVNEDDTYTYSFTYKGYYFYIVYDQYEDTLQFSFLGTDEYKISCTVTIDRVYKNNKANISFVYLYGLHGFDNDSYIDIREYNEKTNYDYPGCGDDEDELINTTLDLVFSSNQIILEKINVKFSDIGFINYK